MSRLFRQTAVVFSLAVIFSLLVASCASTAPAPQAPTQPAAPAAAPATAASPATGSPAAAPSAALKDGVIKVGLTVALSGPAAPFGVPLDQATRILFDKFNEEGGAAIGDTRYKAQVTVYDDGFDSNRVVANARKLIFDDKVNVLIILGGAAMEAVAPLVNENKAATIGYGAARPKKDWKYVMVSAAAADDISQIYPWLAKREPSIKKVGLLCRNDSVGAWYEEADSAAAKEAGLEVVVEKAEPTATDFTPQLRKLIAAGVQSLDTCSYTPGGTGLIVKQARELGYKGKFYDTSGGDLAAIAKVAGAANFEGFTQAGAGFDQPVPKEWNDFITRYIGKYGLPFNAATINRTLPATAYLSALRGAKSLDPDKIIQYMEGNHFTSLYGDTYYRGMGKYGIKHLITAPQPIVEYSGGVAKLLDWTKPVPEDR